MLSGSGRKVDSSVALVFLFAVAAFFTVVVIG